MDSILFNAFSSAVCFQYQAPRKQILTLSDNVKDKWICHISLLTSGYTPGQRSKMQKNEAADQQAYEFSVKMTKI